MEKINFIFKVIAFLYKDRRWIAEVTRCQDHGLFSYEILYYPVGSVSLRGHVEILPPVRNSIERFWKQRRRETDENILNPEFITVVGEKIHKWQNA